MAIKKDTSTTANQQYWAFVEETSREVEKWPAWLRTEPIKENPKRNRPVLKQKQRADEVKS